MRFLVSLLLKVVFSSHDPSIYIELADQYKVMDAASNVAKRNVLAEHLKEVIDTLEQKVWLSLRVLSTG